MSANATIVELRRVRPVKWSQVDKKVEPARLTYVSVFLKYEGCPLLHEDGEPILSPAGQHQEIRAANFARRYGIAPRTFQDWVVAVRGITTPGNQRFRAEPDRAESARSEQHGMCSCCPEWGEE
jgi:hypothetical protein